jgi:membrane-associated phospholipid phosphatase
MAPVATIENLLAAFVSQLVEWDRLVLEAGADARWDPLTVLFVVASTWWVKWPLFVAVGACGDAHCRRRLPRAFVTGLTAVATAAALTALVKDLVDRARPALADPTLHTLVATPGSPSFPSGHAATAFAAAVAVGAFYPRLRVPLLALAAVVGLSRIYLGVHYLLDVLAGAALGTALALVVVWATRRFAAWRGRSDTSPRPA